MIGRTDSVSLLDEFTIRFRLFTIVGPGGSDHASAIRSVAALDLTVSLVELS